jgi:SAM-dependent methyltransferase
VNARSPAAGVYAISSVHGQEKKRKDAKAQSRKACFEDVASRLCAFASSSRAEETTSTHAVNFEDHFSAYAADYAHYRPGHPREMFAWLASIAPGRDLAWDCGTGNGQAAVELARYFDRIYASDASREQIAEAAAHDRVEYHVEPAESSLLAAQSVDLITSAVAVHWFDFERFYAEVRRVLKPGGVIAVWTHHLPDIAPEIDPLIAKYYREILWPYWPERIQYIDQRYRNLPFPFEEIVPPRFEMKVAWTLDQLAGFLSSWSAARIYLEKKGTHPLAEIWDDLASVWGEGDRVREVCWEMHMRVGCDE